jgi:hypothetical protein
MTQRNSVERAPHTTILTQTHSWNVDQRESATRELWRPSHPQISQSAALRHESSHHKSRSSYTEQEVAHDSESQFPRNRCHSEEEDEPTVQSNNRYSKSTSRNYPQDDVDGGNHNDHPEEPNQFRVIDDRDGKVKCTHQ